MQGNIPLTIDRLSEEREKEFRITSVRQIQSLLRSISEKGALVALYYDGTKDFIMTTVLDVSDKGFWVEQGVDMPKNRSIAESKRITLVSSLDQVKIQFPVGEIRAGTHQGYPAFYLPLPASLYRLQYREYFRLAIPSSASLRCVIPINEPQAGKQLEVHAIDISIGGVKLSYAEGDIDFAPGQTYAGCQINLPEVGKINITIVVKTLIIISPKTGQTIQRVGCEFKNLDNASGILLQRYVTKMQREKAGE